MEGSYTHEDFILFLDKLRPYLTIRSYALIDNSSTHKTLPALYKLNDVFNGRYAFSAEYSPYLKPIEKGFSLVKRYLRHHEDDALLNPIRWINKAFRRYSNRRSKGENVRGNWNILFNNHSFYQENF